MAGRLSSFLRKKPQCQVKEREYNLKNYLTVWDLNFLGIGAIIGIGIFILPGFIVATKAGPGVLLSFIIAGLACGFSALAYAELTSSIRGSGSAYSYAYIGVGELPAWIIGWDLILEYALSVSAVAIGWSEHLYNILYACKINLPIYLLKSPIDGGVINLPASMIVMFVALILSLGVKLSALFNNALVIIKLLMILLFIILLLGHINLANWKVFSPFGWNGVFSGAALIFFAYVGFDAISTTADEVVNPQRNLPIAIISSLTISILLYIIMASLLTLVTPYYSLNISSPVSHIMLNLGYPLIASIISIGILSGLTVAILIMFYGLTRIILALSKDQLLPKSYSKVNRYTNVPVKVILICAVIMSCIAGFVSIKTLIELVNIGTLSAFFIVCLSVLILRYTHPTMKRPFKIPLNPLIPMLGLSCCLFLTFYLPKDTWIRFFVWLLIGFIIYFKYSHRRSLLAS